MTISTSGLGNLTQVKTPYKQHFPVKSTQFGNDSDYTSETSIDFSAPKKQKKQRKPLTATKGYKKLHRTKDEVVDFSDTTSALSIVAGVLSLIIGGMGYLFTEVGYDTPEDVKYVVNIDDVLEKRAQNIEEDFNFLNTNINDNAKDSVNKKMMGAVYHYLELYDQAIQLQTDAPDTISFSDYLRSSDNNITPEQEAELNAYFSELVASENLSDFKAISNTMIEDYIKPHAAATETGEDDIDAVLFQKEVNDLIDEIEISENLHQIPFAVTKGALATAVLSLIASLGFGHLPVPKKD